MIDCANSPTPSRHIYWGIFLLALSTLMFEILLTRIFSVIMWYHFAFLAISVAMFGMAAGSMFVYVRLNKLAADDIDKTLALNGLFLSVSIVLAVGAALSLPGIMHSLFGTLSPLVIIGTIYIVVMPPFLFSGIGISLILS